MRSGGVLKLSLWTATIRGFVPQVAQLRIGCAKPKTLSSWQFCFDIFYFDRAMAVDFEHQGICNIGVVEFLDTFFPRGSTRMIAIMPLSS